MERDCIADLGIGVTHSQLSRVLGGLIICALVAGIDGTGIIIMVLIQAIISRTAAAAITSHNWSVE